MEDLQAEREYLGEEWLENCELYEARNLKEDIKSKDQTTLNVLLSAEPARRIASQFNFVGNTTKTSRYLWGE